MNRCEASVYELSDCAKSKNNVSSLWELQFEVSVLLDRDELS